MKNCVRVRYGHEGCGLYKGGIVYLLIFDFNKYLQRELDTPNALMGYRSMWKCLRDKYRLSVKRLVHLSKVVKFKLKEQICIKQPSSYEGTL